MKATPDLQNSIIRIVNILSEARDDWWFIGGAAFFAHGVGTGELKDIDVLLSEGDAKYVTDKLKLRPVQTGSSQLFRSQILLQWFETKIPVEFMAGLEVNTVHGWKAVMPKSRIGLPMGEVGLFVPTADELVEIAHTFGRDKDIERAQLLQKTLMSAP